MVQDYGLSYMVPKANALLSRDGIIRETFKDRDAVGDQEPSAKQIVLFDESELDQLKYDKALQKVLPLLPKAWIITLSAFYSFEVMSTKELIGFAKKIDTELRKSASFRNIRGWKYYSNTRIYFTH